MGEAAYLRATATFPALWDKSRRTIVNNESDDLLRMFNSGFGALADGSIDLRRIADHANLSAYRARLIAIPAFRDGFNLDPIEPGYYSIHALNPTRIVPLGPELEWAPR